MLGQSKSDEVQTVQATPVTARPASPPHPVASHGLAQMFGLDYRAAILAILVDVMLFPTDVADLGTLGAASPITLPISIGAGCVLGFIIYKIQRKWYGDDHDAALIKALVVGLLTAIPVPLTPFVAVPGGILGMIRAIRRK